MKTKGILRLVVIATTTFLWLFVATWKPLSIRGNHWAWYTPYADELAGAYEIGIIALFISSGILALRKEEKHWGYFGLITAILSTLLLPSISLVKE